MKIFAPNESIGKSRFWYFLKKAHKIKKTKGEIISIKKVHEKKNRAIKNFGIWLRYESKSGTINMYKEYRDTLASGAIEQMYLEMAGRHKAKWSSIIVLRIENLRPKECIRSHLKQFQKDDIKFPITHLMYRNHWNRVVSEIKASKPQTTIKN